ncbi:MAG TPA: hypothetical protein VK472_07500 [Allosphingosinicella sp.]|nr:hypothetical protein [Allosphingosinicella sp.]
MKRLASLIATSLLLLPSGAAIAKPKLDPEARLARALEGRVAGEPVDCIQLSRVHSTQVIDHTAIIYDAGSTLYVNRPRAGLESLDRWDTLVTKSFSSQLCSVDVVRLFETGSRMETGTVFLGEFVPYRRVRTARAD